MTAHVQAVSDLPSNHAEQIEFFAQKLGPGDKLTLFRAIYHGKRVLKSVEYLSDETGLSPKRVLTLGKVLEDLGAVRLIKPKGRVLGYERVRTLLAIKDRIVRTAIDRNARDRLVTKRRPRFSGAVEVTVARQRTWRASRITIDDVASFRKAWRIRPTSVQERMNPDSLPEIQFKHGVRYIIGDQGKNQDWGGEYNDLVTTHLRLGSRWVSAAFAFKGPGVSGVLTPAKMGENGDQIQALVDSPSRPEVVFVQYEGEISETIVQQLRTFGSEKAREEQRTIRYGTIAKVDSYRLRRAYAKEFERARRFVPKRRRR